MAKVRSDLRPTLVKRSRELDVRTATRALFSSGADAKLGTSGSAAGESQLEVPNAGERSVQIGPVILSGEEPTRLIVAVGDSMFSEEIGIAKRVERIRWRGDV
jgi:hypothetical protein